MTILQFILALLVIKVLYEQFGLTFQFKAGPGYPDGTPNNTDYLYYINMVSLIKTQRLPVAHQKGPVQMLFQTPK
ncbi:hypothetical protein BJX70DRAFT_397242 [Aspergillus crustosus]